MVSKGFCSEGVEPLRTESSWESVPECPEEGSGSFPGILVSRRVSYYKQTLLSLPSCLTMCPLPLPRAIPRVPSALMVYTQGQHLAVWTLNLQNCEINKPLYKIKLPGVSLRVMHGAYAFRQLKGRQMVEKVSNA